LDKRIAFGLEHVPQKQSYFPLVTRSMSAKYK
jgi:hypothetical protein